MSYEFFPGADFTTAKTPLLRGAGGVFFSCKFKAVQSIPTLLTFDFASPVRFARVDFMTFDFTTLRLYD